MASQSQTPVKGAHLRSRTSSVSATMAPPTSTTPNHRRLSSTLVKPVATPPKTAPRSAKRSSLMLSATERRSLSTTLDKMAESEPQFVSHLTDALLTRLTGCSNLSEAKSLRVSESDAKVRFIDNLDRVENLEELDLSDNEISQIRGLTPLRRLRTLILNTNQITLIEGMETLARLEELDLSWNKIERIPASIKVLASLKSLKLHNNKLSTLRDLHNLRPLKNLASLTIFSNPMAEAEHTRLFAAYTLPQLATLDDFPLDDEERSAAAARFDRAELETLEQELTQARQEIQVMKDEVEKLAKMGVGAKKTETKLGGDVSSLSRRIEQLETENAAKTDLLAKKSTELVGLCELLYEMKQELAFANIDKQFDMSAVDSIVGGGSDFSGMSPPTSSSGFDDIESEMDRLEAAGGLSTPAYSSSTGMMSPLPFAMTGVAQEFREMPYIGKTAPTPSKQSNGLNSRTPKPGMNGAGLPMSKKELFASTNETQQAAYRYKTLKQQERRIQEEKNAIEDVLAAEMAKLAEMVAKLESLRKFSEENPDDPATFATLIEIETLLQTIANQEAINARLRTKIGEVNSRLDPIQSESEQMKSLLGDLDEDTIDSAFDLSMEVKALETQIEDRDETIEKMRLLLEEKGLTQELDKIVVLRKPESSQSMSSTPSLSSNTESTIHTNSHSHSHTHSMEDVLARLREMEENHVARVKRLITGFPQYATENAYWETQPSSVEEAVHTVEQQITDAFGFHFTGSFVTDGTAALRARIKQLESHVDYLEHLKYTNFFNMEDGLEDEESLAELASMTKDGYSLRREENTTNSETEIDQEILFALPKKVDSKGEGEVSGSAANTSDSSSSDEADDGSSSSEDEEDSGDSSDDDEEVETKGSGTTYGVRRERLGQASIKQLWFLWRLLAAKMGTVRNAWEHGAISSSDMQKAMESGEWKYWTGVGRLEFFFQHAMSHISVLEKQIEDMKKTISSPSSSNQSHIDGGDANVAPIVKERDSILEELKKASADLAMKAADAVTLRVEVESLEKRKSEAQEASAKLGEVKIDVDKLSAQKKAYEDEVKHLKSQIEQCTTKKEEVEALRSDYNKLSRDIAKADHAKEEMTSARQELARVQIELAGMQRKRDELEALKKEIKQLQDSKNSIKDTKPTASASATAVTTPSRPVVASSAPSKPVTASSTSTAASNASKVTSTPIQTPKPAATTSTPSNTTTSTPAKTSTSDAAAKSPSKPALVRTPVARATTMHVAFNTDRDLTPPRATPTSSSTSAVESSSAASSDAVSSTPSASSSSLAVPTSSGASSESSTAATTPTLSPSSSSTDLAGDSVSDRLAIYRQREQEARKRKEEESTAAAKRAPPKRSWTIGGRASMPAQTVRSLTTVPSTEPRKSPEPTPAKPKLTPEPVATESPAEPTPAPSTPTKSADVLQDSVSYLSKSARRKSALPKDLEAFLKMSGAPE